MAGQHGSAEPIRIPIRLLACECDPKKIAEKAASSDPAHQPADASARLAESGQKIARELHLAGFTNLFGKLKDGEAYKGCGFASETEVERTREILAKLSNTLPFDEIGSSSNEWENSRIPAGYTYLAQLVGHDLIDTSPAITPIMGTGEPVANFRVYGLGLNTIYGGGPIRNPAPYEANLGKGKTNADRFRFKLGKVRKDNAGSGCPMGDLRDLSRVAHHSGSSGDPSGFPDVLIADSRNDDNAILSQITCLFQLFHNSVVIGLTQSTDSRFSGAEPDGPLLFRTARSIVRLVYQNIVRYDLLPKILHPKVVEHYADEIGNLAAGYEDIPLEFSHAVSRFGHVMIRPHYRLADRGRAFGVREILENNSSRTPAAMPFNEEWVARWSRFFDFTGVVPDRVETLDHQLSAKLGPHMHSGTKTNSLITNPDAFGTSGILYRDFIRGASVPLRSVDSIAGKYKKDLGKHCDLLKKNKERQSRIEAWLNARHDLLLSQQADKSKILSKQEISCIAGDPPLLFYILFESQEGFCNGKKIDGAHLGVLGSAIISDVVFRRLSSQTEESVSSLADLIFGKGILKTMAEMIRYTSRKLPMLDPKFELALI